MTERVQTLFDEAIFALALDGAVLVHTTHSLSEHSALGRPLPEAMAYLPSVVASTPSADYPASLGPWRVWNNPPPDAHRSLFETQNLTTLDISASRLSNTFASSSSKSKRPIPGLEDWDGPVDVTLPIGRPTIEAETYILTTPETLAPAVVSHLESLRRVPKYKRPTQYANSPGGGTAEMIRASMHEGGRSDDVWRKITLIHIEEVLSMLEKKRVIYRSQGEWWSFV